MHISRTGEEIMQIFHELHYNGNTIILMLGIIIGVMSLVVLVSLTSGASGSVTNKISSLGSDLLTVMISDDKGKPIKLDDLYEFRDYSEISEVSPIAQSQVAADYADNSETSTVYGVTGGYKDINGLTIGSGRFINNSDVENHTNVAVISADLAEDSSTETYSNYELYIPFTSLVRLADSVPTSITNFCVAAESDKTLDAAENRMETLLMERFENDDEAFSIMNQSEIMEALSDVTNIL